MKPKSLDYYISENGRSPFKDWLTGLDTETQRRIDAYLKRIAYGGALNNVRNLSDGIYEVKLRWGPGLRVYFGERNNQIIVLLLGGDKDSQFRDIQRAKLLWRTYVSKR